MFRKRFAVLVVMLAVILPVVSKAQQAYTLTDIAARGNKSDQFNLAAINASGQVTGSTVDASGAVHAFLWTPSSPNSSSGALALLSWPKGGTTQTGGNGLNNLGQVVGYISGQNFKNGVRWEVNGTITTLSPIISAYGVNDAGEAVGRAADKKGISYPVLWVNGKAFNLNVAVGNGYEALGINGSGQIIGLSGGGGTGFLWSPSTPNGTSGTSTSLTFQPWAINDNGQIVGTSNDGLVLYSNGTSQLLGFLPGFSDGGGVHGINNLAQVVGNSSNFTTGVDHAFLWDSVNGMRDLNDPAQFLLYNPDGSPVNGWVLAYGIGINDRGQIVGLAYNPTGRQHIFLLTPR